MIRKYFALTCASLSLTAPAIANEQDEASILKVMARAFEAVATSDPAIWHEVQRDEGISFSLRNDKSGKQMMRIGNNADFVTNIKPDGWTYREAFTGRPTIRIRGSLATLWGEYEFWINDTFSHCGVDSVQFAKQDGTWKIVSFAWTVEKEGCPTDPSQD